VKTLALLLLGCLLLQGSALFAQKSAGPTTIILVRHAEKDTMKTDPPLTPRGWERARLLGRILGASGARSTHSTQYRRTSETVAPLDSALGIANEVIEANPDSLEAYARRLAKHLLSAHRGETTVVASHSNVIPLILRALGITERVEISDADYDNLFVVTAAGKGTPALVRLQMGMP
jgi:broad specificity phosphatase PhoE